VKQEAFERRFSPTWDEFALWIRQISGDQAGTLDIEPKALRDKRRFPAMYRQVCHHLTLARTRRYSIGLQERLNQLALDGHQYLYRTRTPLLGTIGRFFANDFPASFRSRWQYMLISALLFVLPAAAMAIAVQLQPELVYSLLDPGEVSRIEDMYDPANDILGRERASDTDIYMFGYYIYNNVSIGFQTFAGGLLFGLGSVFYLAFNGIFIGAVASHLTAVGFTGTFWPFVVGHSSFELTAIVIFGGIGLALGYRALAPGRKSRWHAIRDEAVSGMPLVYGGAAMLVAAAFVEAFWSSTTWPPIAAKHAVGLTLWLLLILYLGLMGRGGRATE
jgi:uncharacterized membrane protein SpoIIM required for sporulation